MKKFFILISTLSVISMFSMINTALGDDGADVFINTDSVGSIDFSGRTFGGTKPPIDDTDPIDIIRAAGGRPPDAFERNYSSVQNKSKKYIVLQIDNDAKLPGLIKILKKFGAVPIITSDSDALRIR